MRRRPRRPPLFPYPPLFGPEPVGDRAQRPGEPGAAEGPARPEDQSHAGARVAVHRHLAVDNPDAPARNTQDRKSTRLNSSHANISYAVFCLKKKKITPYHHV